MAPSEAFSTSAALAKEVAQEGESDGTPEWWKHPT
jgi:hypothetical protein